MDQTTLAKASSFYVILPVLAEVYGAALYLRSRQRRAGRLAWIERTMLICMLACFTAAYTYLTLFYRAASGSAQLNLELFWSYRDAFRWTERGIRIRRLGLARQILLNMLVYVPVGLLMPIVWHGRRHPYVLTLLTGAVLSLLTELVQYFTHKGLCELDDLLNNTIGCMLGAALLALGMACIRRMDRTSKSVQTTEDVK